MKNQKCIWYRPLSELEKQVRMCFNCTEGTVWNLPKNIWQNNWPDAIGVILPQSGRTEGVWEGTADSQQPQKHSKLTKIQ